MITKTVIIGGGSVNWTPKLAQNFFLGGWTGLIGVCHHKNAFRTARRPLPTFTSISEEPK